jgi:hypothetical protein
LEYAFAAPWTVKLEYDYLGLNTWTLNSTVLALNTDQLNVKRHINILAVGLNYKFLFTRTARILSHLPDWNFIRESTGNVHVPPSRPPPLLGREARAGRRRRLNANSKEAMIAPHLRGLQESGPPGRAREVLGGPDLQHTR